MKKLLFAMSLVGIAVVGLSGTAMATAPVGPGWHYTLNLIAVENPKTSDMTGSDRHTIFVAFSPNNGTVTSRIYLREGDFQVCDGNSFDPAYDCAGNKIAQQGATFQLPNNNCTDVAGVCDPATLTCTEGTVGLPCAVSSDCDASCAIVNPDFTCYQVFIRELGGPCTPLIDTDGDGIADACATLQTCGIEDLGADGIAGTADDTVTCSTETVVLVREKGKPTWQNVTKELTSLCLDTDLNGQCDTRVELFENDFEEVFWEFTNTHLRHAQLRFYPTDGDPCGVK